MRFTKANNTAAIAVSTLLAAAVIFLARAEVHDGKSFAIEKALPALELKENPYTLRENWWKGELRKGENKILKHQLFVRNEYWFWLGASQRGAKVSIHIYDGEGKIADAEAFQDKNVAGVRIIPKKSGVHYIRIAVDDTIIEPVEWAVIYGYR
ncbi:MAG: hypothetical protein HKN23_11925 [Verrucomicrobiales bacterium]|nr:hypothetical protein [Verrucomicrobiales bacterium]